MSQEGKQWFQPPKGEGAEAAKRASKLPVVVRLLFCFESAAAYRVITRRRVCMNV